MGASIAVLIPVCGLILFAVVEAVMAAKVLQLLRRPPGALLPDEDCPQTAVVLPLRGADPSLRKCLLALLEQDYPRYTVHAVLDSGADPARAVLESLAGAEHGGRIVLHVLEEIPSKCSLKCAGLAQVLGELENTVKAVVLIDADTEPSRQWLRRMISRLWRSDAAAVSGMRWFIPAGGGVAALMRYVWNAASVVQMCWQDIAWGGCLAVKRDLIASTDLLQRLGRAYGEDTVLDGVLRDYGLTLVFDPGLVLTTREGVGLRGFLGWARRQLVSVRLHHAGWRRVLLFGLLQSLLVMACGVLVLHGLWSGAAVECWTAGLTLAGYELLQVMLLLTGESLVRRRVPARYASEPAVSVRRALALLGVIPLTQLLHGVLLVAAWSCRTVTWRGIPYRIEDGGGVRLLDYRPYVQDENKSNRSL